MTEPCTFGDHDTDALTDGRHEPIQLYSDAMDLVTADPTVLRSYIDGNGERHELNRSEAASGMISRADIARLFGFTLDEVGAVANDRGYRDAHVAALWERHCLRERTLAAYSAFAKTLNKLVTSAGHSEANLTAIRDGILNLASQ